MFNLANLFVPTTARERERTERAMILMSREYSYSCRGGPKNSFDKENDGYCKEGEIEGRGRGRGREDDRKRKGVEEGWEEEEEESEDEEDDNIEEQEEEQEDESTDNERKEDERKGEGEGEDDSESGNKKKSITNDDNGKNQNMISSPNNMRNKVRESNRKYLICSYYQAPSQYSDVACKHGLRRACVLLGTNGMMSKHNSLT